eukprot:9470807-Pyramimonas_sp.AAC.1
MPTPVADWGPRLHPQRPQWARFCKPPPEAIQVPTFYWWMLRGIDRRRPRVVPSCSPLLISERVSHVVPNSPVLSWVLVLDTHRLSSSSSSSSSFSTSPPFLALLA